MTLRSKLFALASLPLAFSCSREDTPTSAAKDAAVAEERVTTPVSAPVPEAARPPDVERGEVVLAWSGKVTASDGAAPAAGSPCTVTLTRWVQQTGPRHRTLVSCAGEKIYDSTAALGANFASTSFVLTESPAAGDGAAGFQYELTETDVGARTGDRSQLRVNTHERALSVLRDAAPVFHVTASVEPKSAPRQGKPLFAAPQ